MMGMESLLPRLVSWSYLLFCVVEQTNFFNSLLLSFHHGLHKTYFKQGKLLHKFNTTNWDWAYGETYFGGVQEPWILEYFNLFFFFSLSFSSLMFIPLSSRHLSRFWRFAMILSMWALLACISSGVDGGSTLATMASKKLDGQTLKSSSLLRSSPPPCTSWKWLPRPATPLLKLCKICGLNNKMPINESKNKFSLVN